VLLLLEQPLDLEGFRQGRYLDAYFYKEMDIRHRFVVTSCCAGTVSCSASLGRSKLLVNRFQIRFLHNEVTQKRHESEKHEMPEKREMIQFKTRPLTSVVVEERSFPDKLEFIQIFLSVWSQFVV
jgi:hypothetical protein